MSSSESPEDELRPAEDPPHLRKRKTSKIILAELSACHAVPPPKKLKTLEHGRDIAPGDCKHVRQLACTPPRGQPSSHDHELFRQAELVHEGETLGRRRNHTVRRRAHGATARALELLCGKHDQHGAATRFEVHPRARGSGARLQQQQQQ